MADDDEPVSPAVKLVVVVIIGIIIGIIIALIIFVLMYYTRTFFFEYCSQEVPYCSMSDYVENPTTALQWGKRHDEIFEIKDNNLYYTPPRNNRSCIPQRPPVIIIPYPQHCTFEIDGQDVDFRQSHDRQEVYTRDGHQILTRSGCRPISSIGGPHPTAGHVSNQWDFD